MSLRFWIAAALLFSVASAGAQDVMKTIADDTCACVADLKKSGGEITDMQLGLCIVKSYNAKKSQLPIDKQVSLSDSEAFEAIAGEIGIKMVETCPEFIMDMADGSTDDANAVANHSMKVEVIDTEADQFVTLNAKDGNGRQHALLLLEYFGTATLFTDGKIKKGDKITVAYKEVEMYDPKMKEFRYYKVITGLTK